MNYDRQLQASFWLMISVQTISALDMPGKGPRKLPSPRSYVAAIMVWAILGLVSDAGAAKAAAVMGWVTVLTGAVVGPFGRVVTDLFSTIGDKFIAGPEIAGPPTPATPGGARPGSTTFQPTKPRQA